MMNSKFRMFEKRIFNLVFSSLGGCLFFINFQIPAHSILRCPDEDAGGEVVISNSSVSLEHIENDDPSIFCQVQVSIFY